MSFTNLHLHHQWPSTHRRQKSHANSSIVDGLLAQFHCIRAAATETHAWTAGHLDVWPCFGRLMDRNGTDLHWSFYTVLFLDIMWYNHEISLISRIMQSHYLSISSILNHFEHFLSYPITWPIMIIHNPSWPMPSDAPAPPAPRLRFASGSAESAAPATVSAWRERLRLSSVERPWVEMGGYGWDMDGIWMGYGSKMNSQCRCKKNYHGGLDEGYGGYGIKMHMME